MANRDLSGQRFERLTAIAATHHNGHSGYWICRCNCGNETIVRGDHLRSGRTRSCGCLHSEAASQRLLARGPIHVTHGASDTRAYQTWLSMRQRCNNPNSRFFSYYGGRGIRICERWSVFENFLADMGQPGPGETLDRIDNHGDYEPANCRWATRQAQQNNRRVNRTITHEGQTRTISEWSRATGIHRNTITQRIDKGYPDDAILSPVRLHDDTGLPIAVAVSAAKRKARTHCKNGHPWNEANTGRQKCGRRCLACHREAEAARKRKA